jgi:thiamine pyrophosphokinase
MQSETAYAVVVLGGGDLPHTARQLLAAAGLVVAADSGASHALAAGRTPDAVVGDSDSIDPALQAQLVEAGVPFEHHPPDKEATDGELALAYAHRAGFERVTLLTGGDIERLDHLLAVVSLLAADGSLDAWVGHARVQQVRPAQPLTLRAPVGATVTLLPLFGPVDGINTTGLMWPLTNEPLAPGSTRGVSNVVQHSPALVSVTSGILIAITPEALS